MKDQFPGGSLLELLQTIMLAFSVAGLCYYCYYLLAPWIWSRNISFQPGDITPWIRKWTGEHDGMEIYALYILVFVNILTALNLYLFNKRIADKRIKQIILWPCVAASCLYVATIGFFPPMNSLQGGTPLVALLKSLFVMALAFPFIAVLCYLQRRSSRWAAVAVALVLAPVCFIATAPISWDDYTYIFAPALRLLKGAAIRDIYFQYDLLPSLFAVVWMKLGLDLNTFQILGQAAYYVTILGVFLLSRHLFHTKELALFLVSALILGRIYASPWEVVSNFQVTPLRLDLWLPLLAVVYWRGPFHWSAGLVCGLLVLLLKNFGIIYSLAYIQLLISLFAVSYFDEGSKESLGQSLLEFGKRCWLSAMIIVLFGCVSYVLFRNGEFGNYSGYYQRLGIGFIQIASNSFYWYVPPLLSMVIILLFRMRKCISPTYLATGLLLTYCVIGNSIYFFGRSHEHNILNIAIVLLFLLFILLDLVARFLEDGDDNEAPRLFLRRHGAIAAAGVVLAVMIVSYSGSILTKTGIQIKNIAKAQVIYPLQADWSVLENRLKIIRVVTGASSKVYFVDESDLVFYYYGGYVPVGYCNPFKTWIFTKNLNLFLQGLLDNGYYLVCSPDMKYLLSNLQYNYDTKVGDTVVAARLAGQGSKQ